MSVTEPRPRKPRASDLRMERLTELARTAKLESFNSFVEELTLPPWLATPILTGRPELLIKPEGGIPPEDVVHMLALIRVLLKTNEALRDHASEVSDIARDAFGQLRGAVGFFDHLARYAAFQHDQVGEEED